MRLLIKNIARLAGIDNHGKLRLQGEEMSVLGQVENAYLIAQDGIIVEFGEMSNLSDTTADEALDVAGCTVLPAICDSHTHIVNAGSREGEFEDKIRGLSYEEIAKRGGGILNSAERLHTTSEEELFQKALPRIGQAFASGVGSMEIKSGYGLTVEDELKMLRVIKRLAKETPMNIRATFLGAHAVPRDYRGRQQEYVDLVCNEMIPAVAKDGLAEFIDVFCDKGFFTVEETAQILKCGAKHGLRPKIHANELDVSGGVQVGLIYDALSVDHLERTTQVEIDLLKKSDTMPTLLAGASFFLGMPYGAGRDMIDSGLGVALASDHNPGSSPSGNMKFIISLACIKMKLTPEEAINAATLNGAYALGCSDVCGSIKVGKRADLWITKPIPSIAYIPYSFGENITKHMIINGKKIDYEQFCI